jgi:serine/threonine protein kinase/tetratricopeptide (TPR) repeat protein
MDRERWERIQSVFHKAVDRPESDRAAVLKAACGGDESLMADVAALLQEDDRCASVLDRDLTGIAHQVLDSPVKSLPLDEFGPYRIKGVLGEGGMGVVYLAEREDLGSLVAIKILRDAWLSPARLARFESEQRTLANLNHPSIARLYDADCLTNGTPWFVMEFVEGSPLTDYCRARECPIEERLRLFRSVCEAVQYAHSQAIIHRDLKPSNILVKKDGTVKLLDFGIAKQLESLDEAGDSTRTALRFMTPAYAAPEQLQGGRAGTRSDVYSLGVVLYELLAGRLPFDLSKKTPGETELAIMHGEPEKPSAVAAKHHGNLRAGKAAWSDLDVLCQTAMHQDPERRYRSVEALIRDVDHYLKGEPLEAQRDTLPYKIGKFARRNRKTVAAAVVIFAIVAAQAAVFTIRLARARNAALAEAARTQRIQRFMLNLFEGGHQEAGPAENLRVIALLDRGVQEARTLNQDPRVQAELYQTLGGIYEKMGKFDRADSLLRSALDQQRLISGPDSAEASENLVALGLLRADQGKYKEAETLIREALAVDGAHLQRNAPALAKATGALGEVLEAAGSYDQAIKVLDEAVRLQFTPGEQSELARSLTSLAEAHFFLGRYEAAESLNQRALAIDRQIYGERHPFVADNLIDLGNIQHQLGHYAEAERYFRQALDITGSWYGKDNPETASDMITLAQTLAFEKHYDEAEELLRQSVAIQEGVYGKVHAHVAFALNALGMVAIKRGDLKEAESDFSRVVDIYRGVYGDKNYTVALATANLAGVYVERKEYTHAESLYRDAVRRFTEALSAGDMNTGIARVKLGRTLLRERRYREAEREILAGSDILSKQTSPAVSWVQAARKDLALVYEALGEPEKAKGVRAELAATGK